MSKNYNTRTALLKSTIADIRVLDAKKINLDGKNILDYISDSGFDSYDTRDPELKNDELDIWNTEISLSKEGHIDVKPKEHAYEDMTDEQQNLLFNNAVQVIDNEVLGSNDNHLMYWQTDGITLSYLYKDKDNDGYDDVEASVFNCYYYSTELYVSNKNLRIFKSDLSNLTSGSSMFWGCSLLNTFNADLSSLEDGYSMFLDCSSLNYFTTTSLSNLTDGSCMFAGCNQLTSFDNDLSSLEWGYYMFCDCSLLNSFTTTSLPHLIDGSCMFAGCNQLTSFNNALYSLEWGIGMFSDCLLDAQSVANIIHTLPQRDYMPDFDDNGEANEGLGCLTIGLGCDATMEDILTFAQECDCDTVEEFLEEFSSKNWLVELQYNGRPTITYNMRRGESLPIYAKLVEVVMTTDKKKRKPLYAYTSQDGTKFYNIIHFNSTNGSTEGYDVFSSLEEAISTYNVKPKN